MQRNCHFLSGAARLVLLLITFFPACRIAAQTPAPHSVATASSHLSDEDLAATREQLFTILRMSPKLTAVLSRDPSLLSNQEYVSHNNPELAQFLQQHPEIARNPEFYLFARNSLPGMRLEEYVWPEINNRRVYVWERYVAETMGFLVFLVILTALLWLLRVLLENRRWNRILKLQSEVHGKLLDKFGSSQELLTYMNTEAGKRFLEAAPLPTGADLAAPAKISLGRVLTPLQLGVVLTLVGVGFLSLRGSIPAEGQTPMLIFGTLGLMLGIGFIISAGLAFLLARHLDLLPKKALTAKEQL